MRKNAMAKNHAQIILLKKKENVNNTENLFNLNSTHELAYTLELWTQQTGTINTQSHHTHHTNNTQKCPENSYEFPEWENLTEIQTDGKHKTPFRKYRF